MMERRLFILGSGLLGMGLISGCKSVRGNQSLVSEQIVSHRSLNTRKKWIEGGTSDNQKQFIEAVRWLKENDKQTFPSTDPRSFLSWNKLLAIHVTCCPHGSRYLLPWHRLFVAYFEAACQYALGDPLFALPYWDWASNPRVPKEFYEIDVLTASRSLKADESLQAETVNQSAIDKLYTLDFDGFHGRIGFQPSLVASFRGQGAAGSLEWTVHNAVHNGIGGIMSNPRQSPTDPLFWLHHCNIDRIWANWEILNPLLKRKDTEVLLEEFPNRKFLVEAGVVRGEDSSWRKATMALKTNVFKAADGTNGLTPTLVESNTNRLAPSTMTCDALVDFEAFGYTFEDLATRSPAVAALSGGEELSVKKSFKPSKISLVNGVVQADFSKDLGFNNALKSLHNKSENAGAQFQFENIPFPSSDELRREIILRYFFVTSETRGFDGGGLDAYKRDDYAGYYVFFAGGHQHDGAAQQDALIAHSLEVSRLLKLINSRESTTSQVRLLIVPYNTKTQKVDTTFFSRQGISVTLEFLSP